jgi:hypothetical protein
LFLTIVSAKITALSKTFQVGAANSRPSAAAGHLKFNHMEISKLKDQGVIIRTKNASLAIDPLIVDNSLPAEAADCDFVLLTTPEQTLEKFGENKRVFSWPGEYEVQGVAVHAFPTNGYDNDHRSQLFFVVYTAEGKLCYLPPLKKEISANVMEAIGDLDLLIFPAGGEEKLWHSTLESIEPKAVLPLPVEGGLSIDSLFVKIGITKPQSTAKLVIKSKNDFPAENMGAFLLD